ncbi:tripartite tricarboxylate transporter permease [Natronohydrobacter thiooxidans]|uniref:tripartite tricarboxylate transporter permease n=1 Tax=Natronohydrobacter thiooxidans TaxID=87172 RepID=UPI0008FF403F|nr:tripartite tricarboxylate transporter permease [Natronohydrobacter thiooxidans]
MIEIFGLLSELSLMTVWIAVAGVIVGIFFGALPGFGGSASLAIMLPVALVLSPLNAMVFLLAIYTGGHYGGGIPAVLMGVPGDASAAATVLDGFPMTQKGQASEALAFLAMGSAVAGIVSIIAFLVFAPPLARFALSFGPPELFMLVIFGLTIIGSIEPANMLKALMAGALGLLIASVGVDPYLGNARMVANIPQLYDGFPFIPSLLGLFCISQMLVLITRDNLVAPGQDVVTPSLKRTLRGMIDCFRHWRAMSIGTLSGTFIGALPGAGATIAAFIAYNVSKNTSSDPRSFGKGNPDGLIAPEAAQNAIVGGSMIPTFALGIPGSGAAAVLMGVMMYMGLRPGPQLFVEQLPLIQLLCLYLLIASVAMIAIGAVAAGAFCRVTRVPLPVLVPLVVVAASIGAYSTRGEIFDLGVMVAFGVLGYLLQRKKYPLSAVVLGLVLGPMAEQYFIQSLVMSNWNYAVFFTRPITMVLWGLIVVSVIVSILLYRKVARGTVEQPH